MRRKLLMLVIGVVIPAGLVCDATLAETRVDFDSLIFGEGSGLASGFDLAPLSTTSFELPNSPSAAARVYGQVEITPHDVTPERDYGVDARLLTNDSTVGRDRYGVAPFDTTNLILTRIRPDRAIDFDRLLGFYQAGVGRVELGWAAGPGERTAVHGPIDWGVGGYGGDFPYFFHKPQDVGFYTMSPLGSANTSPRVSYYSPRIYGVEAAASFLPDTRNTGFQFDYGGTAPGLVGRQVQSDGTREGFTAGFTNVAEAALNYEGRVAGIGVRSSAAYIAGAAIASPSGARFSDLSSAQVGLALNWNGWTAGVGYVLAGPSGYSAARNPRQRANQYEINGGLQYETGPWTFGAGGLYGECAGDPTERSDTQLHMVSAGMRYRFSPALDVGFEIDGIRTLSADFGDYTNLLAIGQLRYRYATGL